MRTALRSRAKLLSVTAVAAIALVVGAWTMPTERDGEQTFEIDIYSQYSHRTGDYCVAAVHEWDGTAPYTYNWFGPLWYGSTDVIWDYANLSPAGVYRQEVEAWDDNENYAYAYKDIYVGPDGNECTV